MPMLTASASLLKSSVEYLCSCFRMECAMPLLGIGLLCSCAHVHLKSDNIAFLRPIISSTTCP